MEISAESTHRNPAWHGALLVVLLAAGQGNPTSPRPSDVVTHPESYSGKTIEWLAQQMRFSTTLRDGRRVVTERVYALVDSERYPMLDQTFAIEGDGHETDAARRIGQTAGDDKVRRVRGTVAGIANLVIYVNGRPTTVRGPRLGNAVIDAPPTGRQP